MRLEDLRASVLYIPGTRPQSREGRPKACSTRRRKTYWSKKCRQWPLITFTATTPIDGMQLWFPYDPKLVTLRGLQICT